MKHDHNHVVEVKGLEKVKERLDRVAKHVKENRNVYLTGAGCLGLGYILKSHAPMFQQVAKNQAVVAYKSPQSNIVVYALGDPGNIVQCIETGTVYASQGQAARELGVAAARVSEHLNGKLPHINGVHLERIGKAPIA